MAASNSRFSSLNYFSILVFLLSILEAGVSIPIDNLEGGSELVGESSWRTSATAILTIGSLVTLIVILFACGGGGCCGLSKIHWFGRTREDGPTSFENPMSAESGGTMLRQLSPMTQIDVRALELDPVVFEPLPTIHNLTPLTSQPSTLSSSSRDLGGFNHPKKPMVIPFATEDSELYAHDWFDEPHKNFPRASIEYVREVGRGWFGQVIEAEAKDIVPFARKIKVLVKLLREDASGIEQMRFLDEARLYRDNNHANVVKLLGHSIEKLPFLLIMEKFPLGDLKSYLIANVTRAEVLSSQGTLIRMALDIAKGLEWMHSSDFMHTDLAARNCQVGSENRIIIGDYGLATKQYKDDYYWNTNVAIPLRWAAPETLHCTIDTIQTLKVSKHANIWTFAVLLWEITEFGKLPYFELNDEDVISRVIADQNYFLGPPTLPYIPAKEELYEIMSACWNTNPQSRLDISSVAKKLDSLLATSCENLTPSKDEFDAKWERLSSTPGSSNPTDGNRKKSVSFTGIVSEPLLAKGRSIEQQRQETEVTFLESASTTLSNKTRKLELSSPFLPPSDSDDDTDTWEKNSHSRSVTQKILEKSPSVQDLMTLTHISASDLADTDSLPFVPNSDLPALPGPDFSHESTGTEFGQTEHNSTSSQNLGISLVENNLSNGKTKLQLPDKHTGSATPNGVNINLIEATPDPKVEINLIHPTPSPGPSKIVSPAVASQPCGENPFNNFEKKPITFVFRDDTPKPLAPLNQVNGKLSVGSGSGRRHTSTPKRSSASPIIVEGYDEECPEEVFDPPSDSTSDFTCDLSPISEKLTRNGELLTTILVGASDDLGLDAYQSVTTQLEGTPPEYNMWDIGLENSASIDDSKGATSKPWATYTINLNETDSQLNGLSDIHPMEGVSYNENTTGTKSTPSPYNVTPMPPFNSEGKGNPKSVARKLFDEDQDSDKGSSSISIDALDETVLGDSKAPSSSEGTLWSDIGHKDEKTMSSKTSALFGGESSSVLAPLNTTESPKYELLEESTDDSEFWSTQLQSVQDAASRTRLLFDLSLVQDDEEKKAGDSFVEDIEAAQEELGSLVFQDLEDPSSMGKVVPESRDDTIQNETKTKLAFLGFDNSAEENHLLESMDSGTEVLSWDPSSIAPETSPTIQKVGENQPDLDFVPSKWDQSLAPVRPAIKSPGDQTLSQPKTNLKKSVSFENKRTQLVYEYPPPPPISDSEEDERLLRAANKPTGIPIAASLDWDLTQEELEDAEIHNEDWEEEEIPKADRMDVYRISGFDNASEAEEFHVRGSNEPFVFQPTVLGELRHTKDKLRLDLSTGEASVLDDDSMKGAQAKLDSGVGSSTNASPAPFNNCDMLPNRRNNNQDHE